MTLEATLSQAVCVRVCKGGGVWSGSNLEYWWLKEAWSTGVSCIVVCG